MNCGSFKNNVTYKLFANKSYIYIYIYGKNRNQSNPKVMNLL